MKFTALIIIISALATTAVASPADLSGSTAPRDLAAQVDGCGAAGSCVGAGGGELCNDRCKRCSGATGPYARGECCGFLLQSCCCYYE